MKTSAEIFNELEKIEELEKLENNFITDLPENLKSELQKIIIYLKIATKEASCGRLDIILPSLLEVMSSTDIIWVIYKFMPHFPELKNAYLQFRKNILDLPELKHVKKSFLSITHEKIKNYYQQSIFSISDEMIKVKQTQAEIQLFGE